MARFAISSYLLLLMGHIYAATAVTVEPSCAVNVKNSGQPVGQLKDLGGIDTYLSYPPSNSTEHAILFVTDIYGIVNLQSKLLADSMAAAGYLVVMPDIFNKDIPEENKPLDFPTWGPKHPPSEADAILAKTIATMRGEYGVKKIGSVGYCWGARFSVRQLARSKALDAVFVAHPTQVEAGEFGAVAGPLSIAAAETDAQFNVAKRRETEDILQKKAVPYQVTLYAGTEHGFAVRADVKDRKKVFAKQGAFSQAIRWFDEWVKT